MLVRNYSKTSESSSSSPKSHCISCFEVKNNKPLERGVGKTKCTDKKNKKMSKATTGTNKSNSQTEEEMMDQSFVLVDADGIPIRPESILIIEEPPRGFVVLRAHGIKTGRLISPSDNAFDNNSFVVLKAHGVRSFSGRCIPPTRKQ